MSDIKTIHKDFIEYYILTQNPQEAAILAGYSKEEALRKGNMLLKSKRISEKIREKVNDYAKNLFITRSYIVSKLLEVVDFSLEKEVVLNKDGTESDRYKFKDAACAIRALSALSKIIQGSSTNYEDTENDIDIENLDIEKI